MKKKGILLMLIIIACVLLLLYFGINLYAKLSAKGSLFSLAEMDKIKKVDAILVLGAGVRRDHTPSNMLEDRLLTALQLYESGVSDTIIVSGDHGQKEYDEVSVMKGYLVEKGIDSERIFMDHAGFSTYDSLYRAKSIFGVKSVVIVTQEYHAYRALMIGRSMKIESAAVSAPILCTDATSYVNQPWYSFRESIARCKDFVWCIVKPNPTYLGEKISLEASGDVTNG